MVNVSKNSFQLDKPPQIIDNLITMSRPPWISVIFLQWLPWLLRMSRPGRPLTRKNILLKSKLEKLEKEDKQGNSLLAVLDMEEDQLGDRAGLVRTKQPGKLNPLLHPDKWSFPYTVSRPVSESQRQR